MIPAAFHSSNDEGDVAAVRMRSVIAAMLDGCHAVLRIISAVTSAVIFSVTPDNEPRTSKGNSSGNSPPDHAGDPGGGAQGKQQSAAPPVPDVLVGEQNDPRAGPTRSGSRHTSGPLAPQFGGVGDIQKDFDYLTGATGRPFPHSNSRSRIPGAVVGDNGIWMRPGGKSGGRIEIPGAGNKLPETLHY